MLLAACGNRLSHDELVASARGEDGTATDASSAPGQGTAAAAGDATGVDAGATQTTLAGTAGAVSGSGGATTGGPSPSGGKTTGVVAASCAKKLSPIVIGTVGEQSGVFGPFLLPIVQGVQAWVASVNASGGLGCHPVKYIVADDGGDPSVHQSQVQRLVEQEHVIAFVAMDAPIAGNASVSYITQHRIPVIGSEGGSSWFYESPMYFTQVSTGDVALDGLVAALAALGKPQGKHALGSVTCLEAALCSSLYGHMPGLAQKFGLDLVYRGQASLTQPDFTSACQSAKDAGVELFAVGMDTNSIRRVITNCNSIGFKPLMVDGGPLVTPSLINDPISEGFLVSLFTIPYVNTSHPEVAAMIATLKKYAPGVAPGTGTMTGWVAAKLFELAAQNIPEPPTSQALLDNLYKVKNNDLGGITIPLTFTEGQPPPKLTCFWLAQVHNKTLVPIGTGERICG
jgi:branched-chain amino acid transport system substrate-binding protein